MTPFTRIQRPLLLPAIALVLAGAGVTASYAVAQSPDPLPDAVPTDGSTNSATPSGGAPEPTAPAASTQIPQALPAAQGMQAAPSDGDADVEDADADEGSSTALNTPVRAGNIRLAIMLIPNVDYERTYVHSVGRVTTISRRGQTHKVDDRVRDELQVRFRLGDVEDDPDRMTVTVLHAERQIGARGATEYLGLPSPGLVLHCWQQDFAVVCKDTQSESLVNWPQWAQLDLRTWITTSSVHTGSRWRRLIPSSIAAGWPEGETTAARASFEVVRSDAAPDSSTLINGTIDTDGTLSVLGDDRRFVATASLNANYDHSTQMLDTMDISWRSEIMADGAIGAVPYQWRRQTHARLTINTSGRR